MARYSGARCIHSVAPTSSRPVRSSAPATLAIKNPRTNIHARAMQPPVFMGQQCKWGHSPFSRKRGRRWIDSGTAAGAHAWVSSLSPGSSLIEFEAEGRRSLVHDLDGGFVSVGTRHHRRGGRLRAWRGPLDPARSLTHAWAPAA